MQTVNVFLTEASLAQFEDSFLNTSESPQKFIFDILKQVAKNTQMAYNEGSFACQEFSAVNPQGMTIPIAIDADELQKHGLHSDGKWVPANMPKPIAYGVKSGEKLWNMLQKYSEIHVYRLKRYNNSLPKNQPKIPMPKCIEQMLHEILIEPVMQRVQQGIDSELEKEFAEIKQT